MKPFAKTLLGTAIAGIMTGNVYAEAFVDDSSLSIRLRNVYFNEMGRSSENETDRREWVQSVIADYKSGYFMDMIGFDFSAGGAFALSDEMEGDSSGYGPSPSSGSRCKATHLPVDGGDTSKCDTNDIGGVQQAFIKFKTGTEGLDLHANYGKKKRSYYTYSDSGSRALPSATYGFDADLNIHGLDLYAANITGFSPRNQSYFEDDLSNGSGSDIDYLRIFGASYSFEFGLDLVAELNRSDDYLKKDFFEARYQMPLDQAMTLELIGRYGTQEEDGSLYGTAGYESDYYDLIAQLDMGALGLRAGYTKVSDGAWDDTSFDGDHGQWESIASNQFDFNAEDEKTWLLGMDYDFAEMGLEGLTLDLYYAKGTDGKEAGVKIGDEWERGTIISYAFGGALEGLDVEWENYTNRGRSGDSDEDGNRVYVNYSFAIF